MDINKLYEEIGEYCPFKLAREIGIKVENHYLDDGKWCGGYMYNVDLDNFYIFINTKIDSESQETTCYLLVQQHLTHKGSALSLAIDDIKRFERAEMAGRKYLKVITEAFLGGFSKTTSTQKA